MKKKKVKRTVNGAYRDMRTSPKFRKRVVQSKKNYSRKRPETHS